jgi:hypothetical protein
VDQLRASIVVSGDLDLPERQIEFLHAVATGQRVVRNAATRRALINRGMIQDTLSWDAITITARGYAALHHQFPARHVVDDRTVRAYIRQRLEERAGIAA